MGGVKVHLVRHSGVEGFVHDCNELKERASVGVVCPELLADVHQAELRVLESESPKVFGFVVLELSPASQQFVAGISFWVVGLPTLWIEARLAAERMEREMTLFHSVLTCFLVDAHE